MFTELEPLLADRTLVLILASAPGGAVRVHVIPKPIRDNDNAEKALTMPLSITGTAAELDRELPAQLASYAQSIVETGSTLNQVRETHKAAVKELEAENKKALDARRKATVHAKSDVKAAGESVTNEGKDAAAPAKPAAPMVSLFDDPPEPTAATNDQPVEHPAV